MNHEMMDEWLVDGRMNGRTYGYDYCTVFGLGWIYFIDEQNKCDVIPRGIGGWLDGLMCAGSMDDCMDEWKKWCFDWIDELMADLMTTALSTGCIDWMDACMNDFVLMFWLDGWLAGWMTVLFAVWLHVWINVWTKEELCKMFWMDKWQTDGCKFSVWMDELMTLECMKDGSINHSFNQSINQLLSTPCTVAHVWVSLVFCP